MRYKFNDGGRRDAGFKGSTGDCVIRAVAIGCDQPYRQTYNDILELQKIMTGGFERGLSRGVSQTVMHRYLTDRGWCAHPVKGNKYLLDTPMQGTHIVSTTNHIICVINRVVHDSWDSRISQRTKCGYPKINGWYTKP